MAKAEKIRVGNRNVSRFVRWPKKVRDGTIRCLVCGQIDEPEYHTLSCVEALDRQSVDKSTFKPRQPSKDQEGGL